MKWIMKVKKTVIATFWLAREYCLFGVEALSVDFVASDLAAYSFLLDSVLSASKVHYTKELNTAILVDK